MTDVDAAICDGLYLLIQADVDGELQPGEAARVGAHLNRCPGCVVLQGRLLALSTQMRQEMPSSSDRANALA